MPTETRENARSLSNCISVISIKSVIEDEMTKQFQQGVKGG